MTKICAKFKSMIDAKKAVDALKSMGYTNARLDAVDNPFEEYSEEIDAGSANTSSLSSLILRSDFSRYNPGKAPLMAANPMVSGMGAYHEIADNYSTRVLVNIEESKIPEVKKVLRDNGASV